MSMNLWPISKEFTLIDSEVSSEESAESVCLNSWETLGMSRWREAEQEQCWGDNDPGNTALLSMGHIEREN